MQRHRADIVVALLLSLATASREAAAQRADVSLNHVYVVVDSVTIAAIEASPFVTNQLGGFRRQTNQTAEGRSWTGVYVHGERTYVEFFPKGTMGGVGFSGLALSVEQPGAIDSVEAWLKRATSLPTTRKLVRGVREGREFNWFHSVSVDHPRGDTLWQVYSWYMENHPEFARVVLQDSTSTSPANISRKRYLSRRHRPDRPLRDIIGVRMSLRVPIAEQLRSELEAIGWRVERGTERGSFHARGPEEEIVVTPVPQGEPYGIRELTFSMLNGPAARQVLELGFSRLELCATRARWTFGRESSGMPPAGSPLC